MRIEGVPFYQQSEGHCGPATLAMALGWSGADATPEELAPRLYTPGMKGTFQADLVAAARREGRLAIPISGLASLLEEFAAGHPVIVFENLALSWLPQWHYAIVFGYDLDREEVLMHSGPERDKRWDLRKFERSWKLADYWGVVILPPGRLAASADEVTHVTAAAGLEQAGQDAAAKRSYEAILKRWPVSLGARVGLANLEFKARRFERAATLLREATVDHPRAASAWHNRAVAEAALNDLRGARVSATRAVRFASAAQKEQFRRTLKPWLTEEETP
jgi:tetratricopeptide (TPR) repeat protein